MKIFICYEDSTIILWIVAFFVLGKVFMITMIFKSMLPITWMSRKVIKNEKTINFCNNYNIILNFNIFQYGASSNLLPIDMMRELIFLSNFCCHANATNRRMHCIWVFDRNLGSIEMSLLRKNIFSKKTKTGAWRSEARTHRESVLLQSLWFFYS